MVATRDRDAKGLSAEEEKSKRRAQSCGARGV
jgi:hypothetical protein